MDQDAKPGYSWIPDIDAFEDLMVEQLIRNSHKGMEAEWRSIPFIDAMKRLRMSVDELEIALRYRVDVEDKAADVANWAFIISDGAKNGPSR